MPQGLRAPRIPVSDELLGEAGDATLGYSIDSESLAMSRDPAPSPLILDSTVPTPLSASPVRGPEPSAGPRAIPPIPSDSRPHFLEESTRTNTRASPVKPPVPLFPPPPPVPMTAPQVSPPKIPSVGPDASDDDLDNVEIVTVLDRDEVDDQPRTKTLAQQNAPIARGKTIDFAPNAPLNPRIDNALARAKTELPRTSMDSLMSRTKSLKRHISAEPTFAEAAFLALEPELEQLPLQGKWWLEGKLPLMLALRRDLRFEVASHVVSKRGNRSITHRDYYILFQDYTQLIIELVHDTQDPESSVQIIDCYPKPAPTASKPQLIEYHRQFGPAVASKATSLVGGKVSDGVVKNALQVLAPNLYLKPIGAASFGVVIYENIKHEVIHKSEEIRAGDVLWIADAKFSGHHLMGSKSVEIGKHEPYTSVITEFDAKKEKFKVVELDVHGKVKAASYKVGDMKHGTIRVFRIANRSHVDW